MTSLHSKGDHVEQLRRLALHKSQIRRPFFLLEEDIRTAGGWQAYNANGSDTTIESTADVLELLATVFVDERLPSKVIQSADITTTAATLVRITGILDTQQRRHAAGPPPTLKAFNVATKKAAATKVRADLKEVARMSGASEKEAGAVAIAFGSLAELRTAYLGTAPVARPQLLCPLLYSRAEGRTSCDGKCCDISARVFQNFAVGSDDLDDGGGGGPAGGGTRQCSMAVSTKLDAKRKNMKPPSGWSVVTPTADEHRAAEWLLVRAEQGTRSSKWFSVHLVALDVFEAAIEAALAALSPAQTRQLLDRPPAQLLCLPLILDLARKIAKGVLRPLQSAQRDAAGLVSGRHHGRAASASASAWSASVADSIMLVVVKFASIKGRASRGRRTILYTQTAWLLAQTALLIILTEHKAWHVHTAANADAADAFVQALVRACDRHALLDSVL